MSAKVGLAFSGGGIRSAAFCSGVLRRLLQREAKIDNLSCVSGGAYVGTAYLDWKYRNGQRDDPKWHQEFFDHMRRRAGYLCDWQNPLSGTIDALFSVATIALVSVIMPAIVWMAFACPLAYLIDFLVGDLLRADICKEDPLKRECVERDPVAIKRTMLFAGLAIGSVFSYIVAKRSPWRKFLFKVIAIAVLVVLGLCFFPWVIHAIMENADPWVQMLVIILGAIVWLAFPVVRAQTAVIMLVYAYSFIIHIFIYKHFFRGIEVSDFALYLMVWVSGIVVWLVPLIGSIQQRLMHVYNRWRLQKAFYSPQSVGKTGCYGIGCYDLILGYPKFTSKKRKILTLADFEDITPFCISNTTVNGWRRTPTDKESFEILTLNPREIRRLDSPYEEDVFLDKLQPDDIRLAEAMAMSAAALAPRMGKMGTSGKDFATDLKIILGVAMGSSILSDPGKERRRNVLLNIVPFVMETIRVLPLVVLPIVAYLYDDEKWITVGVFLYFGILLLLSVIATLPTGADEPGLLEKMTRWFLRNVPYTRFIRNMIGVVHVGPSPPTILHISDGGHIELLGLVSLLQLRLSKIVVVHGGAIASDADYGTELLVSLRMAREKLRCSFTGMDGRDVLEDIRVNFVEKKPGEQPRSYKFKVAYYALNDNDGTANMVGEGEILVIAPRHPNKGVQTKERVTWKEALHDIDVDLEAGTWGTGPELDADEADRLTFCCCECCHSPKYRSVSELCFNPFPHHTTLNQFFTPAMFSAYHREGYRACVEAEAVEFLSG